MAGPRNKVAGLLWRAVKADRLVMKKKKPVVDQKKTTMGRKKKLNTFVEAKEKKSTGCIFWGGNPIFGDENPSFVDKTYVSSRSGEKSNRFNSSPLQLPFRAAALRGEINFPTGQWAQLVTSGHGRAQERQEQGVLFAANKHRTGVTTMMAVIYVRTSR